VFVLLGFGIFVLTDTLAVHAGVEESIHQTGALVGEGDRSGSAAVSASSSAAVLSSPSRSRSTRFLSHPIVKHLRALLSLWGVMMLWEGIWDAAFTAEAEQAGLGRMVLFTLVGLFGLQITDSLFANAGVVPPFAINKRRAVTQQRLGFQLEEQKMLRAEAGGTAHDPEVLAQFEALQQMQQQQQLQQQQQAAPTAATMSGVAKGLNGQHQQQQSPAPLAFSQADLNLHRGLASALSSALDSGGSGGNSTGSDRFPSPVLSPPADSVAALAQSKAPFHVLLDE